MSVTQPVCMGCHMNPNWNPNWKWVPQLDNPLLDVAGQFNNVGLTEEEKEILAHLVEAWKKFDKLKSTCKADFLDAIHKAQQIVALRVAKRVNPDIWVDDV